MDKIEITNVVISNVKELVGTFSADQQFGVDENTRLFGNGSNIDSLSLVSIIVGLESVFSLEHNIDLTLTDDRAMTREHSPFDTIATLAEYIDELVNVSR